MKPTPSEQLEASQIVQRLIENYMEEYAELDTAGVLTALDGIHAKLIKADERLLQPKPKRQPRTRVQVANAPVAATPVGKAIFDPDDSYVNSKPKRGRNG